MHLSSQTKIISLLSCLLFSGMLLLGPGLNIGAALLLIASLFCVWRCPKSIISKETGRLIGVLCFFFAVFLFSTWFHEDALNTLLRPSCLLLAIPILLTLSHTPPKISHINLGIIIGAIGALISALIFYFCVSHGRAFHELPASWGWFSLWSLEFMPIQSGDIAVSLGIFSFIITLYYYRQKH